MAKNYVKMVLDLLMAIFFVLMFNRMLFGGLAFHEIVGLSIGLAFIIHLALNLKWIKQVTRHLFSKKVKLRTKVLYVIDVLVFITLVYTIVSGMMISRYLMPGLYNGNEAFFKVTHMSTAYIALGLVGLHVGLNWQWVIKTMKRVGDLSFEGRTASYIARLAVVIMLVFGIYNIYSTNYFSRVAMLADGFYPQKVAEQRDGANWPAGEQGRYRNHGPAPGSLEGPPYGRGGFEGRGPRGGGGDHDDNAALNTASMVSVFAILGYYIDRRLSRRAKLD